MAAEGMVEIRMSEEAAFRWRVLLPVLTKALTPLGEDAAEMLTLLGESARAIDDALPADLRAEVREREIAEFRMDVIDGQRAAGIRPPAPEPEQEKEPGNG